MSSAPILFIHYGPAHYLRWTFEAARRANPSKQIILLGDKTNRRFARGLADFMEFESLAGGDKEQSFDRVFQVIQGERHRFNKANGVEFWLKFVFRRWFLIEEFLRRENIASFWTFDSDTLILDDLSARERRFQHVEATTQCRGQCLNGWVGSQELVSRYTDCIVQLFSEPDYLAAQRERLKAQAGLAFNEMDAFAEFRLREGVCTQRASEVVEGEAFDDALAMVEDYEVAEERILGRTEVKRLWTSPIGGVWARRHGETVRLLTCNMSWMPDFMWKRILSATRQGGDGNRPREEDLREISARAPAGERLLRQAKVAVLSAKRALRLWCFPRIC